MSTFSERLRIAIIEKDIKPSELAKITGVDKSLISNYIAGKYKAKHDNIYALALALNVSEAWLSGFDVPQERSVNESHCTSDEGIQLYSKLDNIDKAEVRGIMKQMLKAEKYSKE